MHSCESVQFSIESSEGVLKTCHEGRGFLKGNTHLNIKKLRLNEHLSQELIEHEK